MKKPRGISLIERLVPLSLVLGVIIIAALTLYPFLPAVLWAVMVAIAIEPTYQKLVARLNGRKLLAAWLFGIALMMAIVVPMIGLARTLLALVPDALSWVERMARYTSHVGPGSMHELPAFGSFLSSWWETMFHDTTQIASRFQGELKQILLWAFQQTQILGVFIFEFVIGVVLAMIMVYRSERIAELSTSFLDHIGGNFALRLAAHSVVTTRLTVWGVLGAALAQTLVATFSYVVAGVPGWMIWAGITFILSLIQIGPVLVWLPMSVWLWSEGQAYMAVFVFLWGLIVVNITDNLVRPMLVTKDSDLPASLAFLGAVGGLMEWGVVGVFVGPVIVAVCYELVLKWLEPDTLPENELAELKSELAELTATSKSP